MLTKMLARDVMISPVLSVREGQTVPELVTFLTENSISGAPVMDARGKLVGVVSVEDIAEDGTPVSRRESGSHDRGRKRRVSGGARHVSDIMTPTFFTVPDDTPACEIAKTMVAGRIHRLLVTRNAQIVGIVSALDLLKLLTGPPTKRKASRGPASASAGTSVRGGRAARTSATESGRSRPRQR
jgi:CBS domain-containing protein